jgi:hypothetical protein
MNPASADLNKEEHIQRLQTQRFHREEITGEQVLLMLGRKARQVLLCRARVGRSRDVLTLEDVSNSGAPNAIAKLEQFSFDFAVPPAGIFVFLIAQSALPDLRQYAACQQVIGVETSIYYALSRDASAAPFQA